MSNISSLVKNPRYTLQKRERLAGLLGKPQKRAVIVKVYNMAPKKPNSAQRKVALVRINQKTKTKLLHVYIPGEGHNLAEHGVVLIRGGRVPDLPGIKYHIIRGKYDAGSVS